LLKSHQKVLYYDFRLKVANLWINLVLISTKRAGSYY